MSPAPLPVRRWRWLRSRQLTRGTLAVLGLGVLSCGAPSSTHQAAAPGSEQGLARACTPTGPEVCLNARDDNCNGIADEGCGLHTGLVQFLAAWDAPGSDVDLHVIDPNGQLAEVGKASDAGLIKERECPGRRNDCQGVNLENVYLQAGKKAVHGRFLLRVRLEKLGTDELPVRVSLAARLGTRSEERRFVLATEGEERRFSFNW